MSAELETCTTNALMLAARRNALSYHVPDCPQCGASRHGYMQLTDWLRAPAEWKCRKCGYRFLHEPVVSNNRISEPCKVDHVPGNQKTR